MALEILARLSRLPLTEEEKGEMYTRMSGLDLEELQVLLPAAFSDTAVAASLRSRFKGEGSLKRGLPDASFLGGTAGATCKRLKAIAEYRPVFVSPDDILGTTPNAVLVALRWLVLLRNEAPQVTLAELQQARLKKTLNPKKHTVREELYYPSVLAFLSAASCGQTGLRYGGQGYGNVTRPDVQGFINGVHKAPTEVKKQVRPSNDTDVTGVNLNADHIGQEAVYLRAAARRPPESNAALGCMFCRMDRFWIVKYTEPASVQVTPDFPPAHDQKQIVETSNPLFVLMNMRLVDEANSDATLSDVLPVKPSAGFAALVAYVEEIQRLFALPRSLVKFSDGIETDEVSIVAYGRKSLVLRRMPTSTVLKVCKQSLAVTEKRLHVATDGHPNLRRLVSWGTVDVGGSEGLFSYLELEGFGEPLGPQHVEDKASLERMWEQASAGINHLHSKGVLHRDIKPDNMLVFDGVLKINDYDVSCYEEDEEDLSPEDVGTCGFQSPSCLPYRREDDILSLGLAFYFVKTGDRVAARHERLQILSCKLHPDVFPQVMISSVAAALEAVVES